MESAKMSIENAELDIAVAKAGIVPTVSASYSFGTNYFNVKEAIDQSAYFKQLGDNRGHSLGLSVGIPIFDKFAKAIINDTPRQPTDEQMFGHLVVSEEQVQKAEQAWNGVFNKFYDSSAEPLEKQDSIDNLEWGNGKSFNDSIEEEELQKRNMHVE